MEVRNTRRCGRAGPTYVLPFPGGCSSALVSISVKEGRIRSHEGYAGIEVTP